MGEWENLVPSKNTSIQDYTPSGVQQKNEDEGPDVELRGKVEIKKKKWFERCASDFKKYFPKMLFGVAIPEMGKILITKTFDVIYSSIFNEPYSGGGKPGGKGYFFSNGSVVDYDNFFDKKNGNNVDILPSAKKSYDEFIFTNRIDVEDIIAILIRQAKEEGKVSVADLYSIIRRTLKKKDYPREIIAILASDNYRDNRYGWYYEDICNARPGIAGRDRYFLDLPTEVYINN